MPGTELLRKIPSVDEVLRRPEVARLASLASPSLLASWIREALEGLRREVLAGRLDAPGLGQRASALPEGLAARLEALGASPLRRVINATGVVVHTNLGRAPLAPGALDAMATAGASLREVGTTNRTRLADYRAAIGERTGLLVKVHTSNYRIVGFVEEASVAELAALGRERGIPLLVDEGSGHLAPGPGREVMAGEPVVQDLLASGAHLVAFSGDKLLGGPQAGLLAGDPELVTRCAKNPLARALRLDKTRLAALAWTLAQHATGRGSTHVPVLEMCARTPEEIGRRAQEVRERLVRSRAPVEAAVEEGTSRVGGGAAPMRDLPTRLLAIRPRGKSANAMETALRLGNPPVVARIADDRLLVDLRTVDPGEDEVLASALDAAARDIDPHAGR